MPQKMALLELLSVARAGVAQSVFTGTWRPEPQTFGPTRKTDEIALKNGIYECRTCAALQSQNRWNRPTDRGQSAF
jgi:hypothetical protein